MFDVIGDFVKDNMQLVSGVALMPFIAKMMQSISSKMNGSATIEKLLDVWSKALDKAYIPIKLAIGVFAYNTGVFVSSALQKNVFVKMFWKYIVQPLLLLVVGGLGRLGGKLFLLLGDAIREFFTKIEKGLRVESLK